MKIKNPRIIPLLFLMFSLFLAGLFLGRGQNRPVVTTDRIAPEVQTIAPATEPAFPININEASAYDLTFLPGIGPALAEKIVQWRQHNGPFPSPSDLTKVDGIGEKTLEQLIPYITTGG